MALALTIAGSDSGGGAGIQADLKTFSALSVYGASVLTAVTAQNTQRVHSIEMMSPALVRAQLDAVFDDLPIAAVKIGMLGSPAIIRTVAESVRGRDLPIVLDPVMVAKSGDRLLAEEAIATLISELFPFVTIVTPNLPEAADLLGQDMALGEIDQKRQATELLQLGAKWILLKGGHAEGDICTDILTGPEHHRFGSPRITTQNSHGTGCTLSSAIAAGLAQRLSMPQAVSDAHRYLQGAIKAGSTMKIGSGHGPVHHFYQWWPA
jgi:hydroxymethylpyrimidine/phosphomethylpyrimidine kinase